MGSQSIKLPDSDNDPNTIFFAKAEAIRKHTKGKVDCGFWRHNYTWVGYGDRRRDYLDDDTAGKTKDMCKKCGKIRYYSNSM